MNRASLPEETCRTFHLFLDEFHSFTTEGFTSILSETRNYGLSLTVAHQYLDQMQEEVRSAVLGNVGTILCFRIDGTDARELAPHRNPLSASMLEELSNGVEPAFYSTANLKPLSARLASRSLRSTAGETGLSRSLVAATRGHDPRWKVRS